MQEFCIPNSNLYLATGKTSERKIGAKSTNYRKSLAILYPPFCSGHLYFEDFVNQTSDSYWATEKTYREQNLVKIDRLLEIIRHFVSAIL